jgi:hypothetical protein
MKPREGAFVQPGNKALLFCLLVVFLFIEMSFIVRAAWRSDPPERW